MEIKWFAHNDVDPQGGGAAGGQICVNGDLRQSPPEGGCGIPGCNCSAGHWISKIYPRTEDGIVAGFTAKFSTREELEGINLEELEQVAMKKRH